MNQLHRNALASVPMTEEHVEQIYAAYPANRVIRHLCESHERLRAELEGSEILRDEAEKEVAKLKGGGNI